MLQYTVWVWYDKLLAAYSQGEELPPPPISTIKTLLAHGADLHSLSTSGHTILDGMLLNFIKFDGYPYSVDTQQACKSCWMGALRELGFERYQRREYLARERDIHRNVPPHDLGLGFFMKVHFTHTPLSEPQWFWGAFQGPEERNSKTFHSIVYECQIWRSWQLAFAIPKRPKPPPRHKSVSSTTEIIVLKSTTPDCDNTADEFASERENLQNLQAAKGIMHAQQLVWQLFQEIRRGLACLSRYRYEFSAYVLITASILGFGYFARIWIAGIFFMSLRFFKESLS
jgi:hypothetical protein